MLGTRDPSLIDTTLKVSHFITSARKWDVTKLKSLVSDPLLQLILATPIPYNDIPNFICWGLSVNCNFSTKSATWLAPELNLTNSPSWEFSWIWKLDVMPKLKIFLWQLCHALLSTRVVLLKRELQIDPLCPHRHIEIDDMEHLFLGCPIVNHVWRLAKDHNWITINTPLEPHQSVQNWLARLRLSNHLLKLDRIV